MAGAKRVVAWGLPLIGGAVIAGLGVFLASVGLDDADKWAGVFGLFVAVAGLGLSGYGLVVARRQRRGQAVADSVAGGGVTQVRKVRGNLRIGAPQVAPASPPPSLSAASPRQAQPAGESGDQSVIGTWTGGPVRQVDDVGGDTDIDR